MFKELQERLNILSRYMNDSFLKMQVKLLEDKKTTMSEMKNKLDEINRYRGSQTRYCRKIITKLANSNENYSK